MVITATSAMRIRRAYVCLFPLAPMAACVALAWPQSASAAEWSITPGLDLRETYTDNLTLASRGAERSDFVTEVAPNLAVRGGGSRMHLNADYVMRNFFYARTSGASNTQHQLHAAADATLVDDLLFFDGDASLGQQAISPFGAQVADNGNLNGNQAEVRTYTLSPYLRHHFGHSATAELRVSRDGVSSSADNLLDSQSNRVHISLDSGRDFRALQWSALYDAQRIDYKSSDDVDLKRLSGSLRYLLTPRFAATGSAGYERNNYVAIGEKPEGAFWALGADWMPAQRTSISISAGRRYFGNTVSFAAQHRARIAVFSAAYQEEITTARSQFLLPSTSDTAAFLDGLLMNSVPDKVEREKQVSRFIHDANLPPSLVAPVNTFSNRVFLQKNANVSVASRGTKNTLIVTVFHTERDPQSAAGTTASTGALLDDATRQNGVSALWNWALSPRTRLAANAAFSRASAATSDRHDDNMTFRMGVAHQLHPKLNGGIELRRLEKRSSQAGNEFRENALTAFLLMNF